MCLCMVLCFMPTIAFAAEDPVETVEASTSDTSDPESKTYVAQIGTDQYESLDDAIAAAADGDTIQLLADCTTAGMELKKDLTIDGSKEEAAAQAITGEDGAVETPAAPETKGWKITFNDKGIALWGKSLTFRNCEVEMSGIGATPYAEWSWMAICASKDASLTLDHAEMTLDGTGTASNVHAIYFCSNNKLELTNGSVLKIQNYPQDALEWDGGDGGYNVNLTDSTYISDHNRSGFTGTFYATFDNSTVKVLNSAGNGSNGTYFTVKNNSNVLFDGNGAWGISAWRIDMTNNSTLTAANNGYSGIWTRVLNADATCTLDVEGNGTKAFSAATNGGIFFQGNESYTSEIAKGAAVTIKNNAGSGIYTKQAVCNLTIGSATITNNGTGAVNKDGIGADKGGGVYNVGTLNLGDDVILYNNHAANAGDDIYCEDNASILFGAVGTNWILDDCNHAIDGWYDDAENAVNEKDDGTTNTEYHRWNAHDEAKLHIAVYTPTKEAVSGKALKAAHGKIVPTPIDPPTSYITVRATKQWVLDDGGKAADSILVQLLQNGRAYGSPKELTAAKQWTDTWYVPAGYTYTVEEVQVPEGFTATVTGSGTTFTIVNDDIKSGTPKDPSQPTTPTDPGNPENPSTPDKPTDQDTDTDTAVPKTGDTSALAGSALLLMLSACGIAAALRRKEEQ